MRPPVDLADLDLEALARNPGEKGWHVLPGLLTPQQCASLTEVYGDADRYRSTVLM